MIEFFGRNELEKLVASEGGPHVSIYMPTYAAIDAEQNTLRLKTLAQKAENELAEGWMRNRDVRSFLAPLTEILHEPLFCSQGQSGSAFFLTEEKLWAYRLRVEPDERLKISRSFYLRPLVPELHQTAHGLVLTLSENKVALYEVDQDFIREVNVPDLPHDMDTFLNYTSVDRGQQAHSGASVHGRKQSEVFHGQGGMSDTRREDLEHYFRAVNAAVMAQVGHSPLPLILACVDASVSIYRAIHSGVGLCKEHIGGNVDHLPLKDLQRKALDILRTRNVEQRDALADRIREHLDTALASQKPAEVIRGAFQGRIHTLFFDKEAVVEGQFDPMIQTPVIYEDSANVEFNPYNTDLVESAVQQTLRHRGKVYSVARNEMPGRGPLAALFRY